MPWRGELPRDDAADIVCTGDRQAQRVVSALIERGVVISVSSRLSMVIKPLGFRPWEDTAIPSFA